MFWDAFIRLPAAGGTFWHLVTLVNGNLLFWKAIQSQNVESRTYIYYVFSCLSRILAPYLGCAHTCARMARKEWSLGPRSCDLAQISFLEYCFPLHQGFQGIYSAISRFLEIALQSHSKISQNRKKRKFITWKPSFFGSALTTSRR